VEKRYSSYSFSPSVLYGGEWSASRPGPALPPGKRPPVPTVQEAGGGPSGQVWTQTIEEKFFRICRESNLDRPVVQPVANTTMTELPGSQHTISITKFYSEHRREMANLENLDTDRRITLKSKQCVCGLNSSGSQLGPIVGCCEYEKRPFWFHERRGIT
jgi:hypothetical protein